MVGTTLSHYRLLEKIGAGGQGTVYKAEDTRLGRTVVVKILPPELTHKPANLKRFEREARLASQLDHPNICTIFDFGFADDVNYITMQYIAGKNVRELVNGRPLELKSALGIGAQVCDGLAVAHSRGIIHRDIKAGNILVTPEGVAKILDFGLAKLLEDEDEFVNRRSIDRSDLTEVGVPYGTATYAAPEQARGDRVDHRADIFSTGVLLYELLFGTWPFRGKTVVEVRYAVMHSEPLPLADVRQEPQIPRLQALLNRAMAKEPRDRYQKIAEMRDELRGVLAEVAGAPNTTAFAPRHTPGANRSVMTRAMDWFRGRSKSPEATPSMRSASGTNSMPSAADLSVTSFSDGEKKSIAILPFNNLGGDAAAQFYEFGLADAVITELAQLRSLIVRPSSAISKYQGQATDPRQAGRELNVQTVLSAGFLRADNRMRVTAQLLDVATGAMLWSDRIDADASDIFSVQDAIAQRILKGLQLELTSNEQELLGRKPTENAEAYEEYLRGRDNFGRFIFRTVSLEDCDAAIANFRRAVHLDPNFAFAYSGIGACYANKVFKGIGDTTDYSRAESSFSRAIQLDPNVVEARVLMMFIYMARGAKQKARDEIAKLQEQFPNDGSIHFAKANLHRLDGEYDKAIRSWDRLERLDPAARVIASYNRARIYTYQGDSERGLQELEAAAAAEPNHPLVRMVQARILQYHGDIERATNLMRDVLTDNSHLDGLRPIYALMLAAQDKREEALEQLTDRVLKIASVDHDIAYWTASAYALLDNKTRAFEWLERAIKLGNENRQWFERDQNLESLRADSRFTELMQKIEKSK